MPYKTKEARVAHWQKWYAEHKTERAAYKKTLLDTRRERNWRFKMQETARMSPETKQELERMIFINSIKELERPVFIVELHGKKHREYLDEPLPQW